MKVFYTPYLFLILLVVLLCDVTPGGSQTVQETKLKAAFVYRFIQFTNFPQKQREQLTICLESDGEVTDEIERFSGHQAHGLPVKPIRLSSFDGTEGICDVVFVESRSRKELRQVTEAMEKQPTLIISDVPGAVNENVDIALFAEPNRIRFDVNVSQAQQHQLSFSSQLLRLAHKVY